jgi:16S rRNA (adenine1518-N6/adenine1519-N6)-dimethyltransferase
MVQKEMAQRITAKAQSKEMGSFTIFLQTYGTPSLAVNVSRNCFYPAPQVDSSVVKLEFHPPKISNTQEFHTFVRRAYQQRRKMLRSTLSIQGRYSNQRPEELSFEDWIELFHSAHTILSTQFSL